jgi:type VI protein secretion system component Hcp
LRRRLDEERTPEPAVRLEDEQPEERRDERGLADETLRLQTLLGNTSVTTLIARAPLQRDRTAEAGEELHPADAKGGAEAAADGYTMKIEGLGSFELLSFSTSVSGAGSVGRGDEKENPPPREFSASKRADELSPKLTEAAAKGKKFDNVEVTLTKGGKTVMTFKLNDVYISSFQTGGSPGDDRPVESFSLNAGATELEHAPEDK